MRHQCGRVDEGEIAANHLGKLDQLDDSRKGQFRERGILCSDMVVGDVAAAALAKRGQGPTAKEARQMGPGTRQRDLPVTQTKRRRHEHQRRDAVGVQTRQAQGQERTHGEPRQGHGTVARGRAQLGERCLRRGQPVLPVRGSEGGGILTMAREHGRGH